MKLLREPNRAAPPRDYLYARLRCRRAALTLNGIGGRSGPGDPWLACRQEYAWVYLRLDAGLARQLLPFFELAELRNLCIALRYLAVAEPDALQRQLQGSLLQGALQADLLAADRLTTAVNRLERLLSDAYPGFIGLTEVYLRQGPGGLEQQLFSGYLCGSLKKSRNRLIRDCLRYFIDTRNLLALYKHLHWQVPLEPPLLSGGLIEPTRCQKVWRSADRQALQQLLAERAALPEPPGSENPETYLYRGLGQLLQRAGRDPLQLGLVIDYLWRCRIAARNRGLKLANRNTVEKQAGEAV